MNKEELLTKWAEPRKVLDHGHIRIIDVMGDDERIEAAARLSYQKGTRKVSETRGLIRYLMRHQHWSPFEKCVIEIDMKMPIFIARQFVRHRTQSLNELSGRYSELPEEFYVPETDQICHQDKKNKQGRAEPLPVEEALRIQDVLRGEASEAFAEYRGRLDKGVARETARINLPLSTYTQWNSTMNLRNLFNFLSLRLDSHAQWEAQQYANVIAEFVKDWVPLAWEAFEDFDLNAVTFSRQEAELLFDMLQSWKELVVLEDAQPGVPFPNTVLERIEECKTALGIKLSPRETSDFIDKIKLWEKP